MKLKTLNDYIVLLIDLFGLWVLLICPFVLATKLEHTLYLLTYLVSWIPAGCCFGISKWLIKLSEQRKEEKERMLEEEIDPLDIGISSIMREVREEEENLRVEKLQLEFDFEGERNGNV